MQNPKVSIVIPVYNVEKYIKECLDSIINQTYKNLEIITVDNGSPDNCPQILDEYAEKDDRIKVIHQDGGGVSVARNAGLQACTGEIVAFVDSDDFLELNAFEILVRFLLENNLDIAFMGVYINSGDTKIKSGFPSFIDKEVYPPKEILRKVLKDDIGSQMCFKIYRKECFENVSFPVGRIWVDLAIAHLVFDNAKRNVGFLDVPLYNYRMNPDGISKKFNPSKSYFIHLSFFDRLQFAREKSKEDVDVILKKATTFGLGVIHTSYTHKWTNMDIEIKNVKAFLKDNKKEILACRELKGKRKLGIYLYFYCRPLYFIFGKTYKKLFKK